MDIICFPTRMITGMAHGYRRATRQTVAVQDTSYVRNELLCFVFNRFSADTRNNLRTTVSDFYSSDTVASAKETLWQQYSSHLGPYQSHKGKGLKMKNIEDILDATTHIDQKFSSSSKPAEFYAVNLVNLPCFKVDNVMEKVQSIEKLLKELPTRAEVQSIIVLNRPPAITSPQRSTPSLTIDTVDDQSESGKDAADSSINTTHQPQLTISGTVLDNNDSDGGSESESSEVDSDDGKPLLIQSMPDPIVIPETQLDATQSASILLSPGSVVQNILDQSVQTSGILSPSVGSPARSVTPMSGSTSQALMSEQFTDSRTLPASGRWPKQKNRPTTEKDEGSFTVVKKKTKKQSMVVGNKKNTAISSNRKKHLFITRIASDIETDCVKQYICKQSIVSSCELINVGKDGNRYKSFHAIIETDHLKKVLTPDFWPEGVAVRRYFFKNSSL